MSWLGRFELRYVKGRFVLLCVAAIFVVGLSVGLGPDTTLAADPPPILWGKEPLVCPTGSEAGQCSIPRGVAADSRNGHVFVADQENYRVVEFNALGQFVKAWGWDVVASGPGDDTVVPEDQFEICVPEDGDFCKAGTSGGSVGQIVIPQGIAIDSSGGVYVAEGNFGSRRVQKFDRKGNPVLMFGGDVNKTKVEEAAPEAEQNLCPVDPGDVCQAATEGTGNGQFGALIAGDYLTIDDNGTASDADDRIYVGDVERIQVFDAEGHYIEDWPDLDGVLAGEIVQSLANDATGDIYATFNGKDDVRKLTPAGIELNTPRFEVKHPTAVAVDLVGNVFAFGPTTTGSGSVVFLDPIIEFDPAGNVIGEFGKGEFSGSTGLSTSLCPGSDPPGNLYVTNAATGKGLPSDEAFLRAYGTDPIGCFKARTLPVTDIEETTATFNGTVNPSGEVVTECFFEYGTTASYGQVASCDDPDASELGTGSVPVSVHANLTGLEKGTVYHVRLIAEVGGETETGADVEFKTHGPPVISDEHTVSTTDTEATLKALINPEGFATSYHFEYTPQAAFEAESFEGAQSTTALGVGNDTVAHPVAVNLKDLASGTTYRWRVVASNESGVTEGQAHVFATHVLPDSGSDSCANSAFRTNDAALLPDCRAYEMVSPVDKNGGDIVKGLSGAGDPGGYIQASPDGNRITYTSFSAFGDPPNAFNFNQYLATRHDRGEAGEGWSSEGIHPPVSGQRVDDSEFGVFREFMAFTPDLCSAWLVDYQTPALTSDGQEGYRNLYRRDNCGAGAGSLETLIPNPPYELPPGTTENYVGPDSVEGSSDDSRHAIFTAQAQLNDEAATGTNTQIYDRFCSIAASEVCDAVSGGLSLVSVLPNGSGGDPAPGDGRGFAAGGNSEVGSGNVNNLDNAVSEDGSRVYWTEGGAGSGEIYLRLHPEQGIVAGEFTGGKCSKSATLACTIPVSGAGTAFFWTATPDGSKALYSEGEDLHIFDLQEAEEEKPPALPIAQHVKGVAGMSADLSRIYFVSTDVLPGAGQNSESDEAVGGQPNLYLSDEGAVSFVATLVTGDVGAKEPGAPVLAYNLISRSPYERATRVTPDGDRIVFQSRGLLTGYDNAAEDGRASVEVFTYEVGGELDCISCNPSGARPSGVQELRQLFTAAWNPILPTNVQAAAWIATWEHRLHSLNVLSVDGSRLFFNSYDSLLPRDTNGAMDVYEWETAGAGGCDSQDPSYFAQNGGCLYLISTGKSPFESEFWEASPDGDNVFFTTESSLVPRDTGSVDLYDARVGGGFPVPIVKAPCEGEACQSPPPPPELPGGASATYSGPGDPPRGNKSRCPKGKRKVRRAGKTRCVEKRAKHGKKQQGRASHYRGAIR